MTKEISIFEEITSLSTEQINPNTINIDLVETEEILRMINNEDKLVPFAVEKEIPNITKAVEIIVSAIKNGGGLIYVGAGNFRKIGRS
jgi:Predicted sugar phosphate isomerase